SSGRLTKTETTKVNLTHSNVAPRVDFRFDASRQTPEVELISLVKAGLTRTDDYQGLIRKAFGNGTLSHQSKIEYDVPSVKRLLEEDGFFANRHKLPSSLSEKFKDVQAIISKRRHMLKTLKIEVGKLEKASAEKSVLEAFIDRETSIIEHLSEAVQALFFERLVFQEAVPERYNFSRETITLALYNAALDIYNQYVLQKGLSADKRHNRKEEFNRIFVKVNIAIVNGQLIAGLLDGQAAQVAGIVEALISSLNKVKWENNSKEDVYARNLLELELKKATEHLTKQTGQPSLFVVGVSPPKQLTWNKAVFAYKPSEDVKEFFNIKEDEKLLKDFEEVFGNSSEKSSDGSYQKWEDVLSAKLQEAGALVSDEERRLEEASAHSNSRASAASASLASSSSSTGSSNTANTATPLTLSRDDIRNQAPQSPSPLPVIEAANLPSKENKTVPSNPPRRRKRVINLDKLAPTIDYTTLIQNIRDHLEFAAWGKRGVFTSSWTGLLVEGSSLKALPTTVRKIKETIDDNNGLRLTNEQKWDQIKRLVALARHERHSKRLPTTEEYYRIFEKNDQAIFDYFQREKEVNSVGLQSLIGEIKTFIEEIDWDPKSHFYAIQKPDGTEKPVPKHVAKQYSVITHYLADPTAQNASRAFQKIEAIALDACHSDSNRNRSRATASYYSIFSGQRAEVKGKLETRDAEIKAKPQRSQVCLDELRELYKHIRGYEWSANGWFSGIFGKNTICLEKNLGRPDQLPKHVKAQLLAMSVLFNVDGTNKNGALDKALTVYEKVTKEWSGANNNNNSSRFQDTTQYYSSFQGIRSPDEISVKLRGLRAEQQNRQRIRS
ncbi:MAG: hypothetical protein ACYC0J_07010, partial [Gammaproteobacteria bacterium]